MTADETHEQAIIRAKTAAWQFFTADDEESRVLVRSGARSESSARFFAALDQFRAALVDAQEVRIDALEDALGGLVTAIDSEYGPDTTVQWIGEPSRAARAVLGVESGEPT